VSKRRHKPHGSAVAAPTASVLYDVDMTASAEAVYKNLYHPVKAAEGRGDYNSAHITRFDMVKDAVKRVIPGDPINKKHALRGELSNLFRLKKGRMRICWIASSKIRRVCIMFISETLRKEGDAHDPYSILQNMVSSGTFDSIFTQFGVKMPKTRSRKSR
jgi:mRNA-degrading endonuclease RelE of RelBE toxin-antitoxin system